jgi:hypothetical protein
MRFQFVGVSSFFSSSKNCVQTAEDAVMLPFIPPAKPPRLLLRAAEVCAGVPLAKHFKRVCQSELLLVLSKMLLVLSVYKSATVLMRL